jgi:hypothetical protein
MTKTITTQYQLNHSELQALVQAHLEQLHPELKTQETRFTIDGGRDTWSARVSFSCTVPQQ